MRSIGRFQLRSMVGQGGFGTVYRAYDPVLDREVALKVPNFVTREPEKIKRFLTEAKAAARLRHPNIVAVFEAGEADGVDYIATEFVTGEALSQRLKRGRPSLRQAAQWVRDLALALAYAHSEGVIHRDIKPANIMIGTNQRPQLMDFGLAKVLADTAPAGFHRPTGRAGATVSIATVDGTIMGTPAYMAPEQARGDVKTVGPHSDQYSLGVVLYELLTGRRPVVNIHARGGIVSEQPARPRQLNRKIPRNLEAVCLKAMAKKPAHRYADAADLAVDLQHWLQADPVGARPFTLPERVVRWSKGNPKLAAAVVSVLAIMAITLSYVSLQLLHTRSDLALMQVELEKTHESLAKFLHDDDPRVRAIAAASRWGAANPTRPTLVSRGAKLDPKNYADPDVDSLILMFRAADIEFRKANRHRPEDPKVQAEHQVLLEQFASVLDKSKDCKREKYPPANNQHWIQLRLKTSAHPEIVLYKVKWFGGDWSGWYVPGFNDKVAGNIRFWSCFDDHEYEVITTSRKEFQRYVDDLP